MPANLENSAVATGLEKVIPIPKKGNAKDCWNYRTIALISQASKVMLKFLQARLQQYVNHELPDVQAGFSKRRGTSIKLPTAAGSSKKQESSRKTSISALLTMPKPLTVWITILKKEINPEYLLEGPMLKLNSNTMATSCEELTHWKRPWCWERLKAGEEDNRGWDGWMASPT